MKHEWGGVLSAMLLGIVLVPFQAYAALKGLLAVKEGGWFRTPKSGKITEFFDRLDLGGRLRWLLPRRRRRGHKGRVSKAVDVGGFSWLTRRRSRLAPAIIIVILVPMVGLTVLSTTVSVAIAAPDVYYLHSGGMSGVSPWGRSMDTTAPTETDAAWQQINKGTDLYWYSTIYPTGDGDGGIAAGDYTFTMYVGSLPNPGKSISFRVHVGLVNPDGSDYENITTSALQTVDSSTTSPMEISLGSGAAQTFTASNPKRIRLWIEGVSSVAGGNFSMTYDGVSAPTNLGTPVVTVPENILLLALVAPTIPLAISLWRRRRRALKGATS